MLWIETGLVLMSLLVAFAFPTFGSRWFEKVEYRFSQLSHRRVLSVVLVGIVALSFRAAVLPLAPVPEPVVHDEFGYLLSADTFAHGRLTNPTHPMWEHFETFHVIFHPSYSSVYPPAQGLILAAGRIIGGPFWGVWFSLGLMCAAITWMLQGWLSAGWALLGGLLAVLRFGVFGYWANSYWGGAAGAIGGALVLGAVPRVKRDLRLRDGAILSVGLAVLASSRPYEGLVLSLPVAFALLSWIIRTKNQFRYRIRRLVVTVAVLLTISALGTGYYFWRVTGSPLRIPYQVEFETYGIAPFMLWQSPRKPPVFHHAIMQKMYVEDILVKSYQHGFSPFTFVAKIFWAWSFYLGPALSLPFCMLAFILPVGLRWKDNSEFTRFLIIVFFCYAAGLAAETFFHPHYAAPITGLILALVLLAMQRLRAWNWHRKPTGLSLARSIPVICVIMFTLRAFAAPLHLPRYQFYAAPWYEWTVPTFGRGAIVQRLQDIAGRHLVIVRYKPEHQVFYEWVYNDADIDNSKIAWAREMTPAEDEQLIHYFKDRQVWLLEADENPPRLTRYAALEAKPAKDGKPD